MKIPLLHIEDICRRRPRHRHCQVLATPRRSPLILRLFSRSHALTLSESRSSLHVPHVIDEEAQQSRRNVVSFHSRPQGHSRHSSLDPSSYPSTPTHRVTATSSKIQQSFQLPRNIRLPASTLPSPATPRIPSRPATTHKPKTIHCCTSILSPDYSTLQLCQTNQSNTSQQHTHLPKQTIYHCPLVLYRHIIPPAADSFVLSSNSMQLPHTSSPPMRVQNLLILNMALVTLQLHDPHFWLNLIPASRRNTDVPLTTQMNKFIPPPQTQSHSNLTPHIAIATFLLQHKRTSPPPLLRAE